MLLLTLILIICCCFDWKVILLEMELSIEFIVVELILLLLLQEIQHLSEFMLLLLFVMESEVIIVCRFS